MTDDLHDRLRAADPVQDRRTSPSSPTSIRELMEQAMNTSESPSADRSMTSRRSPWLVAAAAVTVLALGGAGAAGLLSGDEPGDTGGSRPALVLALPDSDVMSSCIQFSVDVLAAMPTAFSGTVRSVESGTVLLGVDRWYRGGKGETVALRNPENAMSSIDGIEFVEGRRYLVTASESDTVNSCGYTAPWSASMAADFEAAFGQ